MGIGKRTFYPTQQAKDYINQIMESGRISYGPFCQQFEQEIANIHGCNYGVSFASGTDALLIALNTMKLLHGWQDGDEVIVPALTFVATVNVCLHLRLKPVLVDVEPDYYGIDASKIEQIITKRTKAIIPVHTFGMPCDISEITDIDCSLRIIQDSCEAMFTRQLGLLLGDYGGIVCFSTYMAHLLQTGVGGLAVTNNQEYAKKMRSLANHGLTSNTLNSTEFDPSRDFVFDEIGYSSRMTELQAALGVAQLSNWQAMIQQRQTNAAYLTSNLSDSQDYLQLPAVRPNTEHSFMMYPIVCRREGDRDNLRLHLHKNGIGSRLMLPLTNQPCYRGMFNEDDYPVARWINSNGFYIGCHPHLSYDDLGYTIEKVREFFK